MASPFRGSRRLPVPGRRLIAAAAGLAVAAALVPLFPEARFLFWSGAILVSALLPVDLLLRPRRGAIEVSRRIEPLYHIGYASHYTLRVRNVSRRACILALRETLPAGVEGELLRRRLRLAPGGDAEWQVRFVALERGALSFPPLGLRVAHPFALLEHQERVDLEDKLIVAPGRPRFQTEWLISRAALLEESGERTVRRRGRDREFESLREYVAGDEIRRIDWKASARRGRPQVRQYQSERNAQVILALDCGRLMGTLIDGITKLDLVMTPLLDLAAVALTRREHVGLCAFDSRPRAFLPPRSGLAQLGEMAAVLARLPSPREATSFLRFVRYLEAKHRKRSLVLVFTDFTDELTAEEMYASVSSLRRRHVLVFVGVGDPHLRAIRDQPRGDTRSLLEKAVAAQLLLERKRTLARMDRLGILTVDSEPRELAGPLIGRYLDIRLQGIL